MPSPERPTSLGVLRAGLVFVWLATAFVSVVELDGQSSELLTQAGWTNPLAIRAVILVGAGIDLALGLGMALRPGRGIYRTALVMTGLMTVAGTVVVPMLWLHPLGPLTKNIPLAACLWVLLREERRN
jgi:hypothetical protein